MTAIYSILHMFVDGVCALAMFGVFIPQENGYFYMLLYNFCAFALQMPLGIILDALASERLPISAQTVPASRTKPLSAQRCASLPVFRAFSWLLHRGAWRLMHDHWGIDPPHHTRDWQCPVPYRGRHRGDCGRLLQKLAWKRPRHFRGARSLWPIPWDFSRKRRPLAAMLLDGCPCHAAFWPCHVLVAGTYGSPHRFPGAFSSDNRKNVIFSR